MIAKFHRLNTDFQIEYFIVGACHSPDGAYFVLKELEEDRETAIQENVFKRKLDEVKLAKLQHDLSKEDDVFKRQELEIKIERLNFQMKRSESLFTSAIKELDFIRKMLAEVSKERKYSHLSDEEAFNLIQRDEWFNEFVRRAENYLLTSGFIPHSELDAMRMHPDFSTKIIPKIAEIRNSLLTQNKNVLLESQNKILSN